MYFQKILILLKKEKNLIKKLKHLEMHKKLLKEIQSI